MKNHLSVSNNSSAKQSGIMECWNVGWIVYCLLSMVYCLPMAHQAMSQDKQESASKAPVTMNVSCKISDGIKTIKVLASRKENKKTIAAEDLKSPVNLYLNEVKENNPADGTGWIGKLYLDDEGEGTFEFPSNFNTLTSALHEYTFIVKIDSDPKYEDAEEEIIISNAKISIKYSGDDSIKTATAVLSEWKDSVYIPVPEAELKLFIRRTFSLLPIGEEGLVTDENGEISAELPSDIPGDADGTITIVASVIDHETYGTVETTQKVPWSILPKMNEDMGRTLWSSGGSPPIPLILVSLSIIVIIWGTLIYLVLQLVKIKRIGKQRIQ